MGKIRWAKPKDVKVRDLDDPAVRESLRRAAEQSARNEIRQRRRRLLSSA